MDKEHIIAEIKRTAAEYGGKPLGIARFKKATGITQSDWEGKYWARWGDAQIEAGFTPNSMTAAFDEEWIIEQLIALIRELGQYPVRAEFQLKKHRDGTFPVWQVFKRVGTKAELASKVMEYCNQRNGYDDVIEICRPIVDTPQTAKKRHNDSADDLQLGFVYLMKSGRYYKLGRSAAVGRREYDLAIQLPEKVTTVHEIKTDDPAGIEAYWHRRFAEKRLNGEWFDLNAADIKAFKRRKFM